MKTLVILALAVIAALVLYSLAPKSVKTETSTSTSIVTQKERVAVEKTAPVQTPSDVFPTSVEEKLRKHGLSIQDGHEIVLQ